MRINISYLRNKHYSIRVSRWLSLKFRGDAYHYYLFENAAILKSYENSRNDKAKLLVDKYGRLWYHVYSRDSSNGRVKEFFYFVESATDADEKHAKKNSSARYRGSLPYFFATEKYDFTLYDEPMVENDGYEEFLREEILRMNE